MDEAVAKVLEMIQHNEEEFTVLRNLRIGACRLLWVHFPKCPNGHKVMVFKGDGPDITKKIMPHFGLEGSPIARFEATERGWRYAMIFGDALNESLAKEYAGVVSSEVHYAGPF